MGRFINADALSSTGQGLLGNNMYAYCKNNPVMTADTNGYLGVLALCGISAVVSGIIDYAGQVIENHINGMTGIQAWSEINVGSVASSMFSGAISAVPGMGIVGEVVDTVGSNIIEHGINTLLGEEDFSINKIAQGIKNDYIFSAIMPGFLPSKDLPLFIRDIKLEAREAGIKGTKKLQKYLDFKQITTILINGFNSNTKSNLQDRMGLG